jgi:putative heme-binding domain-containing protein
LKQLRDPEIEAALARHFGGSRPTTDADKQALIGRARILVRGGGGRAHEGKPLYQALCAQCHTLFAEGGKIGPELTGYERSNLEFLLPSVVDPSAGLREEFTNFVVGTRDGRTLTGFIETQTSRTVTLRALDGQTTMLPRTEIASIAGQPESVMPEGLLAVLTDQQIKDLFAYLMAPGPVAQAGAAAAVAK